MGPIATNASHAVDQIKDTASSARANLVDFGAHAMKFLDSARVQEARAVDSVLGHIGLQRRVSALRPVWAFAAGILVGGSVALILAPTSGKKLRERIRALLGPREARNGVKKGAPDVKNVEPPAEVVPGSSTADAPKSANGVDPSSVAGTPSLR